MTSDGRDNNLPPFRTVEVPFSMRPLKSPKRQHSTGKLSSSKKAKPYAMQSTRCTNEEEFSKVLSEKEKHISLLMKEAAGLKSDVEELSISESVEIGDVRIKLKQLKTSESLRLRALEEENKALKMNLAELLESEDVLIGDLNAQLCKLLKPTRKKSDDEQKQELIDLPILQHDRKMEKITMDKSIVSRQSSHDEEKEFSQPKCISDLIQVRDISITSKNARISDSLEKIRIDELNNEIKKLQDIMKLHGMDVYAHYPLAIKSMPEYSTAALISKQGKRDVEKATEDMRACEISKSGSDSSGAGSLNDNDRKKKNQSLQKEVLELREYVDELSNSETVLIGELRYKIKQLQLDGKMQTEKLEKEVQKLKEQVQESAAQVEQLETENKSIFASLNANFSISTSEDSSTKKLCLEKLFSKHANAGENNTIQRDQIGMILSCPRQKEKKLGTAPEPKESSSIQESEPKSALAPKLTTVSSEPSFAGRRPLGNLKLSQNEVKCIDKEVKKKIYQLSKEVNKWRLKATLLVEKKNIARTLEKENTQLKERNEKLRADLEIACGRLLPAVPMNPQTTSQNKRALSPDRYIV